MLGCGHIVSSDEGRQCFERLQKRALDELDKQLQESTAVWRIVIGHHPIRSCGHHGNSDELLAWLDPILHRHGVHAYINGHDHDLQLISREDCCSITDDRGDVYPAMHGRKMLYVTSGAGSKITRRERYSRFLDFRGDGNGFVGVVARPTDLTITYYDETAAVVHEVEVQRDPPTEAAPAPAAAAAAAALPELEEVGAHGLLGVIAPLW